MSSTRAAAQLESRVFGRQHRALMHRRMRRTGNNVSFAENRTRRAWLPNVQTKRFPSLLAMKKQGQAESQVGEHRGSVPDSEAGATQSVRLRVSTHALRCIERAGGLDNYLLYSRRDRVGHSRLADSLRAELVALWERENGVAFNRRAILYHRKQGQDYVAAMKEQHAGASRPSNSTRQSLDSLD